MKLRALNQEAPALTPDELHKRGNALTTQIRKAAVEAVRESMHAEFLERKPSLSIADIRRWRHRAQTALKAWQEVDALASELLREVEKTSNLMRPNQWDGES